ncbi:MAG: NosD domain-containing protein, partial [Candidatus Woesearchaeota archaeon]
KMEALLAAVTIAFLLVTLGAGLKVTQAQTLTITLNPDGSVAPASSAIQMKGNTYVVTENLNCSICIKKGNIVLDGANHTLQEPGSRKSSIAITLMASNVTVTGFHISGWKAGVYGAYNNNTITNNVFINNHQAVAIYASNYVVSKNSISDSNIAILINSGAQQPQGDVNHIIHNQLFNNNWAFDISDSNGTTITRNNVIDNTVILTLGTLKANATIAGAHMFYLNKFVNNTQVLHVPFWGPFVSSAVTISPAGRCDNGSIGNYWSDYYSKYPNASEIDHLGIGDTPYSITEIVPWSIDSQEGSHLEGTTVLGIAADNYPILTPIDNSNDATQLSPSPLASSVSTSRPSHEIELSSLIILFLFVFGSVLVTGIYRRKKLLQCNI